MELDLKSVWPEWKLIEIIRTGTYGTVYKAQRKSFNETFYSAIKIIRIPQDQMGLQEELERSMSEEEKKYYYKSYAEEIVKGITILESLKGASNIVPIEDYSVEEEQTGYTIYIRSELLMNLKQYFREVRNKPSRSN